MAISDELNRIIQAKADIKSALEEKGLTIGDSSTLDEFPGLIQEMEVGGGGSDTSTIIDLIEGDITSFEIPNGTTKIRNNGFSGTGLTNITIPNTVTQIGNSAFQGCTGLTNITIPNTVTQIGSSAFAGITYLRSIIIPDLVTQIGAKCFQNCPNLQYMIFLETTPPTLGDSLALQNTGSKPIYVKNIAVNTYKDAYGFKVYNTRIKPLASATYDASTYTVTASGRDTLELYIDSSLINSSVYTFTPGAADTSHNIIVKSVDPSLGVLDTYNLEVLVPAESGSEDPGGDETYNYTLTPEFNSELNCYEIPQSSRIEADGYEQGGCFPDLWVLNGNTGSNSSDYAIHANIDFNPPWDQNGGKDAGVINSVTITLYEATPGYLYINQDSSQTKGTLTQDPNNSLVYTYTITDDQGYQQFSITNYVNQEFAGMKIAKIEYTYTPYEV